MPARSLPVSVTAAMRGSSIKLGDVLGLDEEVGEHARRAARPGGTGPRVASAVWGTFDACFSRPTLPTISAGAAKRITCHRGKFHGMTASTGPSGW